MMFQKFDYLLKSYWIQKVDIKNAYQWIKSFEIYANMFYLGNVYLTNTNNFFSSSSDNLLHFTHW